MDFQKALQTKDTNFESILEIMKLRNEPEKVDSVRNLLVVVNLILEYFMNREEDELKIPVVYFPISQEYAQELCEDFVALKLGLYTNKDWKNYLCDSLSKDVLFIPSDVITQKQHLALRDNHKFENRLAKILSRSRNEFTDFGRSLIYSERLLKDFQSYRDANKSYNRKSVNKYWYLRHSFSDNDDFLKGSCPLSFVHGDADEFYEHLLENDGATKIQNIVVFPTKSPDGRYSEFCANSFQKPYLDDFVSTDCGLKNVYFFYFSRKPYRLRRLFDIKQRMKERIQIFDDESYDFISFTYEEALTLTNQKPIEHLIVSVGKDSNEIQEDYETLFDEITNGLDRHVSRRNEMSLCFNDELSKDYASKILEETEADDNLVTEIFRLNNRLWKEKAEIALQHFVFKSNVFIVTGNDIDEQLKNSVRAFLLSQYGAQKITFGTFGDLRGYYCGGEYRNEIKDNKIIIISFRSDYTDSIFHKYPNSFDPYCINNDQQLLEISNYFFLRQYYDWGKYNYGKAIRKILKSEFRNSEMKPILTEYKHPTKRLPEDTREEETDRNTSRTVQKTKVIYTNGNSQEFWRSEWMLYKFGDHLGIAPLSDLADLYESVNDLSIQPLSSLVRRVNNQFIDSQKDKDNRSERMFKEQPLYGLTQDEIESDTQLWKILLDKRVEQYGCKNVYEEVMSNFNERYRVSYHSFKRWLEPDYGIPRARKVQKFLVEDYLGIRPPYINLIRRIKERTKSDTEGITISIRHFLNIALLNDDFNIVYNALSDETRDLLDINSTKDVENIVSDVKERINFEPVKSISQ